MVDTLEDKKIDDNTDDVGDAQQALQVNLGDSSKLVGDLMTIQGLFFDKSEFKSGTKAGKVKLDEFTQSK